jgi:hypothetical protein
VHRTVREITIADEMKMPAVQTILMQLPDAPRNRFESVLNTGASDVHVLSLSSKFLAGLGAPVQLVDVSFVFGRDWTQAAHKL